MLFITSSAIVDKLHFLPSPMIPLLLFAVPIAQLRVLVPVLARASLLVMERKMKSRKKKKGKRKRPSEWPVAGRESSRFSLSLSLPNRAHTCCLRWAAVRLSVCLWGYLLLCSYNLAFINSAVCLCHHSCRQCLSSSSSSINSRSANLQTEINGFVLTGCEL